MELTVKEFDPRRAEELAKELRDAAREVAK